MIRMIMNLSLGGLVDLIISSIFFYYVFAFVIILVWCTISAILEKDWKELKKLIGWYFLIVFSILNGIAIIGSIVSLLFYEELAINNIKLSSVLITFGICFIIGIIFSIIGDKLANAEQREFEKEFGTEKERRELINIIGHGNWILMKKEQRKEYLRKLRNKEEIIY